MTKKTKETKSTEKSTIKEKKNLLLKALTPTKKSDDKNEKIKNTKPAKKTDVKSDKKSEKKVSVKAEKKVTSKSDKKSEKVSDKKFEKKSDKNNLEKLDKKAKKITKKEEKKPKTLVKDKVQKTLTEKTGKSSKTTKTVLEKSTSKVLPKSTRSSAKKPVTFSPEYYDLPYRYNQTVIKLLAQTPSHLFIYWDISDEDRQKLKDQYGEYVFEITKPVLIIYNETMNYSFEVDINDFANSWYLEVNDSDCEYKIELGRRPIPVNYSYIPQYDVEKNGPIQEIQTPYIYISSSNELVAPNDHVLFNITEPIYFRNVKTNQIIAKKFEDLPFVYKDAKFVSTYKLYKKLFNENIDDYLDLTNPSSGNPSSGSLSSRFK